MNKQSAPLCFGKKYLLLALLFSVVVLRCAIESTPPVARTMEVTVESPITKQVEGKFIVKGSIKIDPPEPIITIQMRVYDQFNNIRPEFTYHLEHIPPVKETIIIENDVGLYVECSDNTFKGMYSAILTVGTENHQKDVKGLLFLDEEKSFVILNDDSLIVDTTETIPLRGTAYSSLSKLSPHSFSFVVVDTFGEDKTSLFTIEKSSIPFLKKQVDLLIDGGFRIKYKEGSVNTLYQCICSFSDGIQTVSDKIIFRYKGDSIATKRGIFFDSTQKSIFFPNDTIFLKGIIQTKYPLRMGSIAITINAKNGMNSFFDLTMDSIISPKIKTSLGQDLNVKAVLTDSIPMGEYYFDVAVVDSGQKYHGQFPFTIGVKDSSVKMNVEPLPNPIIVNRNVSIKGNITSTQLLDSRKISFSVIASGGEDMSDEFMIAFRENIVISKAIDFHKDLELQIKPLPIVVSDIYRLMIHVDCGDTVKSFSIPMEVEGADKHVIFDTPTSFGSITQGDTLNVKGMVHLPIAMSSTVLQAEVCDSAGMVTTDFQIIRIEPGPPSKKIDLFADVKMRVIVSEDIPTRHYSVYLSVDNGTHYFVKIPFTVKEKSDVK